MSIFRLRPARASAEARGVEVVTDLDALVSRSVAFRFQGETFEIKPLTTGETLAAYNAFSKVDELAKKSRITGPEILDAYEAIFTTVCPSFKRRHLEKLMPSQLAALFNLVLETVTGRVYSREELQKKTPQQPLSPAQGS